MKVGSLVELVDDNWPNDRVNEPVVRPVKCKIYTVRDIVNNGTSIMLEEIVNPEQHYLEGYTETSFLTRRFRELQPPMEICIEEIMSMDTTGID